MTLIEKIISLRAIPPFDLIRESELALVADACSDRQYAPGAIVSSPEKPLQKLHIVIEGEIASASTGKVLKVIGIPQLLFNFKCADSYQASSDGASCLIVNKGNLFTMINECPNLLTGFLELNAPFEICR